MEIRGDSGNDISNDDLGGESDRSPSNGMMAAVVAGYERRFGCRPALVVRAPGRVNLIGEHTDYNGLPVLPFAIRQSHFLAVGPGERPVLEIANLDPRYPAKSIALENLGEMSPAGEWDNYARAALLGLVGEGIITRVHFTARALRRGMRALVGSNLPSGVGLSSSSALVVGFALAALHLEGIECDRQRLAAVLAAAEHYVGTRGGGMDQTVCLLGRERHALKIDFAPLEVEAVPFQGDVEVFLADSGVRVEKAGEGLRLYNQRPAECRLAEVLFGSKARAAGKAELGRVRLWDLVKAPLSMRHESVLELIGQLFDQPSYSVSDLCRQVDSFSNRGFRPESALELYVGFMAGQDLDEPPGGFKLRQRAQHVIGEAWRVEQAVEALRRKDWQRLGELINASHASCRDLYEISCPELERLVAAGNEAGALGSRLTGAGFGGCTLHLVRTSDRAHFEASMRRQLGESLRMFPVAPSAGAEVTA